MSDSTLLLLRHGCVGWKWEGRYVGSTDLALSEEGVAQLAAVAPRLRRWAPIARCYCSPRLRARQSAAAISSVLDAPPVIADDVREVDFGLWEGKSFMEISQSDPARVEDWARLAPDFAFPGGEALADFQRRVERFTARVASERGTTLVVTHGGVVRAMLCRLLGLEPRHALAFAVAPGTLCAVKTADGLGVLAELVPVNP